MSLIITEPIKTVNGLLTKAIAAESQLLYKLQRQDFLLIATFDASGFAAFAVAGDQTANFAVNDIIYVESNVAEDRGFHTITGVNFSAPDTRLSTATPYTANGTQGYINNLTTRPNYRIKVKISNGLGDIVIADNLFYVPNQAGVLNFDVGDLLISYMKLASPFSQEYFLNIIEEFTLPAGTPPTNGIVPALSSNTNDDGGGLVMATYFIDGLINDVIVGNYYYYGKLEGGFYEPAGLIEVLSVIIAAGDNKVLLNTPFLGGGTYTLASPLVAYNTTVLQAISAEKQLLDLGGANMWENLLRVGANPTITVDKWLSVGNTLIPWNLQDNDKWRLSADMMQGDSVDYLSVQAPLEIGTFRIRIEYQVEATGNTSGIVRMAGIVDGIQKGLADFPLVTGRGNFMEIELINDIVGSTYGIKPNPTTPDGMITVLVIYAIEMLTTKAKLLTKFINPLLWRGWNRTVSYLIDSEVTTRISADNFGLRSRGVDINKENPIGLTRSNQNKNIATVIIDPITQGNYAFIECFIIDNTLSFIYSETLYYRVEPDCDGIMLDWLNRSGGVEQWLFTELDVFTIDQDRGIVAERPLNTDIEFISRTKRRFSKSFRQSMLLQASNLTLDQLQALEEIKGTESLRVYLSKDGTNFIDAIVSSDFATPYDPKSITHRITLTIEFPDNFIFERAKLY